MPNNAENSHENSTKHDQKIGIQAAFANVRSIKGKDLEIFNYLEEHQIDFCVVTETWLTNTTNDNIWVKSAEINKNCYTLHSKIREKGQGGGVALIIKENLNITEIKMDQRQSFEFGFWNIKSVDTSINLIIIYRPPQIEGITVNKFTDEFIKFLSEILPTYKNLIILGDFSIHINDEDNVDGLNWTETIVALGLQQWINF